ncbi:MAG: hypothetical protein JWN38_129 [Candidatus Saccharibacteria bacterium]|nr:hypothetical protein [Candidatus Saccharibacteria bacterium]
MKFVVKPADDSFEMMLEAGQYARIWQEHSETILNAFKNITGLEFQQRLITARITNGTYGNAGLPGKAMILPGNYAAEDRKICTLMHELGHRLLGGNALNSVALGLVADTDENFNDWQWYEHRHLYLFLHDAVADAFGPEYAERCTKDELNNEPEYYHEAWEWAMNLTFEQRQRAVRLLTAEALPRNRWHERDDLDEILPRDPAEWFKKLHPE